MKMKKLICGISCIFSLGVTSVTYAENSETTAPMQMPMMEKNYGKFMLDRLEYVAADEAGLAWEANVWYGGDYNRVRLKTEGEQEDDTLAYSVDLVYSRLISMFWDWQIGAATDQVDADGQQESRYSLVTGFRGLAPYWFETDAMLYVSDAGDVSAVLEAEYDWLFTQKLILQARLETMVAAQEVVEFGIAKGLNFIETGLRLRYEIKREFAPYIGVNLHQFFGEAADMRTDDSEVMGVAGVRIWF